MKKPLIIAGLGFAVLLTVAAILSSRGNKTPTPSLGSSTTSTINPSDLPVLASAMPPFEGISNWWNTTDNKPLTPESLKGKVVLIDFWTYSCINCLRTLPYLKSLHDQYADKGLVIIGVHTPEFDFEGKADNVAREITKLGIKYPVALDNVYGTWNAYHNQYWPAEYLFDANGQLRHTHFGEGEYDVTEQAIRALLAEHSAADLGKEVAPATAQDLGKIGTRETYFGLGRGKEFMGSPQPNSTPRTYKSVKDVPDNFWTANGTWQFSQEYAEAQSKNAFFLFNIEASKTHLVLESADHTDKRISISIDGGESTIMTINQATLYTVGEFPQGGRHIIMIQMLDAGVRFYSATFS